MRRTAIGVIRKLDRWPWYEWVEYLREVRGNSGFRKDGVREVWQRSR